MLAVSSPAFAQAYTIPVSIGAGPLPNSLQDLARQTGTELLFDRDLVSGLQSPDVRGEFTTEAALRQLLAETNLAVRRAASGAWVVERPAAAPLARQDAVVAEILVIGRRTQNTDIRRFETDVQPYVVVTKAELLGAHRDDIEQYFSSRITSNTQGPAGSLAPSGNTLSSIDLRGLGSQDTLVLIDGRRMPSAAFVQADLNAIPLHAIQRIEVLTGAAGGIYGFGALGGVVNVVLDRGSRGLDLHFTQGVTSRGDARREAAEANFGWTSKDDKTDFALFAAHAETASLLVGKRSYAVRDRRRTAELLGPDWYRSQFPNGNSISVVSPYDFDLDTFEFVLSPPLAFKPEFGGVTLPSNYSFLPAGFSGDAAALRAALTQHAGELDFSLSEGEANSDLGANPRTDSLLVNLRHKFGAGLEAYADAVVLRSRGESHDRKLSGDGFVDSTSAVNPFSRFLDISFPIERADRRVSKRVETTRYTAGLVAELPFDWRGAAEASFGAFRYAASGSSDLPGPLSYLFLLGDPSDLDVNPLGDWNAFQRALAQDRGQLSVEVANQIRFRNQSLRLAGPLFTTQAGPTTLTLLAERRSERMPAYTEHHATTSLGETVESETIRPSQSSATTSFYAELRSRLFDEHARFIPLRGLEVQFAVRRDDQEAEFQRDILETSLGLIRTRFAGTAYTAGAKISPTGWLMLRGSYATGEQPPVLEGLVTLQPMMTTVAYATDPRRGDTPLGEDGEYLFQWGGNPNLKTLRAETTFLGAMITPFGADGPSFAIDYSRIRKTRDVLAFLAEDVLAHEDFWPERVTRARLTDTDRASGYTAGRVTMLDTRYMNGAGMDVDTMDVRAEWPLSFAGGRLRLYADATRQMRNAQTEMFQPDTQRAGFLDGPLKWRANSGFEWSTSQFTIGANLQYFGRYSVRRPGLLSSGDEFNIMVQGSEFVASQTYLDLHASWRPFPSGIGQLRDLSLEFGVVNVLDAAPPRQSSGLGALGPGYSLYGDPRQRRFELTLSTYF